MRKVIVKKVASHKTYWEVAVYLDDTISFGDDLMLAESVAREIMPSNPTSDIKRIFVRKAQKITNPNSNNNDLIFLAGTSAGQHIENLVRPTNIKTYSAPVASINDGITAATIEISEEETTQAKRIFEAGYDETALNSFTTLLFEKKATVAKIKTVSFANLAENAELVEKRLNLPKGTCAHAQDTANLNEFFKNKIKQELKDKTEAIEENLKTFENKLIEVGIDPEAEATKQIQDFEELRKKTDSTTSAKYEKKLKTIEDDQKKLETKKQRIEEERTTLKTKKEELQKTKESTAETEAAIIACNQNLRDIEAKKNQLVAQSKQLANVDLTSHMLKQLVAFQSVKKQYKNTRDDINVHVHAITEHFYQSLPNEPERIKEILQYVDYGNQVDQITFVKSRLITAIYEAADQYKAKLSTVAESERKKIIDDFNKAFFPFASITFENNSFKLSYSETVDFKEITKIVAEQIFKQTKDESKSKDKKKSQRDFQPKSQRELLVETFNKNFYPFASIQLPSEDISYDTYVNYQREMQREWNEIFHETLAKSPKPELDANKIAARKEAASIFNNKYKPFVCVTFDYDKPRFEFTTVANIIFDKAVNLFNHYINKIIGNKVMYRPKAIESFNKLFGNYITLEEKDDKLQLTAKQAAHSIDAQTAVALFKSAFDELKSASAKEASIQSDFESYCKVFINDFTKLKLFLSVTNDGNISIYNVTPLQLERKSSLTEGKRLDLQSVDFKTLECALTHCLETCAHQKTGGTIIKTSESAPLVITALEAANKEIDSVLKIKSAAQVSSIVKLDPELFKLEIQQERNVLIAKSAQLCYRPNAKFNISTLSVRMNEHFATQNDALTNRKNAFAYEEKQIKKLGITPPDRTKEIKDLDKKLGDIKEAEIHFIEISGNGKGNFEKNIESLQSSPNAMASSNVELSLEDKAKRINSSLAHFERATEQQKILDIWKTSTAPAIAEQFTNKHVELKAKLDIDQPLSNQNEAFNLIAQHKNLVASLSIEHTQATAASTELSTIKTSIKERLKVLEENITKSNSELTDPVKGYIAKFNAQFVLATKKSYISENDSKLLDGQFDAAYRSNKNIQQTFQKINEIEQFTNAIETALKDTCKAECDAIVTDLRKKTDSLKTLLCSEIVKETLVENQPDIDLNTVEYKTISATRIKDVQSMFLGRERAILDAQNVQLPALKPIIKDKEKASAYPIDEPLPELKKAFGAYIDNEITQLKTLSAETLKAKDAYYAKLLCHIVTNCLMNLNYWETHTGKKKKIVSRGATQYAIPPAVVYLLSRIKSPTYADWQTDADQAHALIKELQKTASSIKGYTLRFSTQKPADHEIEENILYVYLNADNIFEFTAKDSLKNIVTKPFSYEADPSKREKNEEYLNEEYLFVYLNTKSNSFQRKTKVTKLDGNVELVDKPLTEEEANIYKQLHSKCKKPSSGNLLGAVFSNEQKLNDTIFEVTKLQEFRSSSEYDNYHENTRQLYDWIAQLPTDTEPTRFSSNAHTFVLNAVDGVYAASKENKNSIDNAFPKHTVVRNGTASEENNFVFVNHNELNAIHIGEVDPRASLLVQNPNGKEPPINPVRIPTPAGPARNKKKGIPTWLKTALKILGYIGLGFAGLVLAAVVVAAIIYTAPVSIPFIASLGVVIAAKAGVFGATLFTAAGVTVTAETAIGAGLLISILAVPFTFVAYGIKKGISKLFDVCFGKKKSDIIIEELPEETPEKPQDGSEPQNNNASLIPVSQQPSPDLRSLLDPDNTPPMLPVVELINNNATAEDGNLTELPADKGQPTLQDKPGNSDTGSSVENNNNNQTKSGLAKSQVIEGQPDGSDVSKQTVENRSENSNAQGEPIIPVNDGSQKPGHTNDTTGIMEVLKSGTESGTPSSSPKASDLTNENNNVGNTYMKRFGSKPSSAETSPDTSPYSSGNSNSSSGSSSSKNSLENVDVKELARNRKELVQVQKEKQALAQNSLLKAPKKDPTTDPRHVEVIRKKVTKNKTTEQKKEQTFSLKPGNQN